MDKKIVLLALASMFLLSIVIGAQLMVGVAAVVQEPGVNEGDWADYICFWNGTELPDPSERVELINATILEVSGTNVTFETIVHYADGHNETDINVVDVDTGHGNATGIIIAKNLNAGDFIYTDPPPSGPFEISFEGATINETISREYVGEIVEVNHLNITTIETDPETGATYIQIWNFYWFRATGMLAEMSYYYLVQSVVGPEYWMELKILIIDMIPEFPPALILPLFMIATLAAVFLGKAIWSTKKLTRKPTFHA
ncbi:MAG: hypothetical protein ACUVRA_07280 [Candidatus Bathyarchaeaceae archaeon]